MSFRTGVSLLSNLLVRDTLITARPFFDSTFIFLLLLIAYDLWSTGKVHRATAWAPPSW